MSNYRQSLKHYIWSNKQALYYRSSIPGSSRIVQHRWTDLIDGRADRCQVIHEDPQRPVYTQVVDICLGDQLPGMLMQQSGIYTLPDNIDGKQHEGVCKSKSAIYSLYRSVQRGRAIICGLEDRLQTIALIDTIGGNVVHKLGIMLSHSSYKMAITGIIHCRQTHGRRIECMTTDEGLVHVVAVERRRLMIVEASLSVDDEYGLNASYVVNQPYGKTVVYASCYSGQLSKIVIRY